VIRIKIDYEKDILIKPGDKIYLIKYYDHSQTKESIEEIRRNPPLLWVVGKIVNEHTMDLFYIILNCGAIGRYKKPIWKNTVMKGDIKSKEVIYTIPEDFGK
jgi:hypothetical protein